MTAAEIVAARPISAVWAALGGGPIRNGRARAFFRDGDGDQAIHLDEAKACWFDHRDGRGGGVLDLVSIARNCDRHAALRWLADLKGAALDDWQLTAAERRLYAAKVHAEEAERRDCRWWAMTARELGEECLQTAKGDERFSLTALVQRSTRRRTARLKPTGAQPRRSREAAKVTLLATFRTWREQEPELTRTMVWAGMKHEERIQITVAACIMQMEMEAEYGAAA